MLVLDPRLSVLLCPVSDYSKGFGGKYGVQKDRMDKVSVSRLGGVSCADGGVLTEPCRALPCGCRRWVPARVLRGTHTRTCFPRAGPRAAML